jgi:hypothetical protein
MTRLANGVAAVSIASASPTLPLTRQLSGFSTLPFPLAAVTPAEGPGRPLSGYSEAEAVFGMPWSPAAQAVEAPMPAGSPAPLAPSPAKSWATPSTVGGLSRALGSTPSDGSPGSWTSGSPQSWGNGPKFGSTSPGIEFGVEGSPGAASCAGGSPSAAESLRLSTAPSPLGAADDRRLSMASTVARC